MFVRGLGLPLVGICLGLLALPGRLDAQYSLRFSTGRGEILSSGFLVSNEGYLATSFHAAQNATAGKLAVSRFQTFDLAGWVAADKAHDLIIVAIKNPPKNLKLAELDVVGPPQGAEVVVTPGPSSLPLARQWLANVPQDLLASGQLFGEVAQPGAVVRPAGVAVPPRGLPALPKLIVRRRLSGAELFAGLPPRDDSAPAGAPNTDVLVLNVGLETSYAGSPVWDSAGGKIYGMISGVTDSQGRLRTAVGARHVAALLPQGKATAKPFSQLKKYEDPLDPAAAPAAGATSATNYHLSLADRFDAYSDRLTGWERDVGELRKTLAATNGTLVDLRTKVDELAAEARQIEANPEETFTTTEERQVRDRDPKTGKVTTRTERVRVTRRRLSARQVTSISNLSTERSEAAVKLRETWFAWNHDNSFELPLAEPRLERGRRELFYLVDPFELRSEDQHRDLLQRIDDVISQGGAPGMYFIARGICKLRLRKSAEAAADFKDAEDIDGSLQQLAAAAEGRRLIIDGDTSKGAALVSKAAKLAPTDAAVLFLAARAEADKSAYSQATRGLTAALDKGAEAAETHAALAWLLATTSAGDATNGRSALTHARQACFATEDNDWLCLAALAAAYARNSEFDRAAAAMDQAKVLAPIECHALCDTWKSTVDAKKPIEREWR